MTTVGRLPELLYKPKRAFASDKVQNVETGENGEYLFEGLEPGITYEVSGPFAPGA